MLLANDTQRNKTSMPRLSSGEHNKYIKLIQNSIKLVLLKKVYLCILAWTDSCEWQGMCSR